MNKLEFKIIYRDGKYWFDDQFPNKLNGVITPQEYSMIINGLHSRLKSVSAFVYLLFILVSCLLFLCRLFKLNFVHFLAIVIVTSVVDLVLIIYCITFVAYNSGKYRKFIKSLNDQFQSRSVSFSSPRILFKFRIHYPNATVGDIKNNDGDDNFIGDNINIISINNDSNNNNVSETSPLLNKKSVV
ncbi:hypothetical protein RB653_000835 [Dictyostelium firmibasis]|uniref:Uncharacterized protein n=1 Tax=Dictyostelium firmibasis TaxID=79012 RepID=A0AAN7U3Z3_9MYCE